MPPPWWYDSVAELYAPSSTHAPSMRQPKVGPLKAVCETAASQPTQGAPPRAASPSA